MNECWFKYFSRHSGKNPFRKGLFWFVACWYDQQGWENTAALVWDSCDTASAAWKWRAANASMPLTVSSLVSLGIQPTEWYCSHLEGGGGNDLAGGVGGWQNRTGLATWVISDSQLPHTHIWPAFLLGNFWSYQVDSQYEPPQKPKTLQFHLSR